MGILSKLKENLRLKDEVEKTLIVDGKYLAYRKFNIFHRILHVFIFVTVAYQILTGFPLKYSDASWAKPLYYLMGGTFGAMTIHRVYGLIMFLTFLVTVFYCTLLIILNTDRIKKIGVFDALPMLPRLKDAIDIYHQVTYYLGIRKAPPDFDEFIWIDKFDFFAVGWGMFAIGVTGFILWFPEFFTHYLHFPNWAISVAYLAHTDEAFVALGWLGLVHLYFAHFGPSKFPMDWVWLTGTFNEVELMEEKPRLYRKIIKKLGEECPEFLEKYPFLKERYEFIKSIEKLPVEEQILKIIHKAHEIERQINKELYERRREVECQN